MLKAEQAKYAAVYELLQVPIYNKLDDGGVTDGVLLIDIEGVGVNEIAGVLLGVTLGVTLGVLLGGGVTLGVTLIVALGVTVRVGVIVIDGVLLGVILIDGVIETEGVGNGTISCVAQPYAISNTTTDDEVNPLGREIIYPAFI